MTDGASGQAAGFRVSSAARFGRTELVLRRERAATATLAGVVTDSTNKPITNAEVMLPDLGKGTGTNEQGAFVLRDIPAGLQHVTVRHVGDDLVETAVDVRRRTDDRTPLHAGAEHDVGFGGRHGEVHRSRARRLRGESEGRARPFPHARRPSASGRAVDSRGADFSAWSKGLYHGIARLGRIIPSQRDVPPRGRLQKIGLDKSDSLKFAPLWERSRPSGQQPDLGQATSSTQ